MSSPVNLEGLTEEQFRRFMGTFDHVCCDCDGVLWSGGVPIEGAGAVVTRLAKGKTLNFVSNNSTATPEHYRELFKLAGVEHGYERLITPAWALCRYLQSLGTQDPLYCVASEQTVRQLTEAGFHCITGPEQAVAELSAVARLSAAPGGVTAVVMDSDYAVNIHKLHRCVSALADPSVLFVSGAPDTLVPLAPGRTVMGAGVFTSLVAAQCGREPLVLAKPARAFGDMLLRHAAIRDPNRTLFIGDSMAQDIKFARTMGFRSLLVLSGVSSLADVTSPLASLSENVPVAAAAAAGTSRDREDDRAVAVPDYFATSLGALRNKMAAC